MDIKRLKYREQKFRKYFQSKRKCDVCKERTTWVYNPNVGHSHCEKCGYRKIPIKNILINYDGKIMEKEDETKADNKKSIERKNHIKNDGTYLSKLLNKKVNCRFLNWQTIEGILVDFNKYEIILIINEVEQIIIFKHGLFSIKESSPVIDINEQSTDDRI